MNRLNHFTSLNKKKYILTKFYKINGSFHIILNRSKSLNALNYEMIKEITYLLHQCEKNNDILLIIIYSNNLKSFCSGGDMKELANASKNLNTINPYQFIYNEYNMNLLISKLTKPYICLINGIIMGGGAGLSIHGTYRIMTEKIIFAMPESNAHFITDTGGTYFLSHLTLLFNKQEEKNVSLAIGIFLALTGIQITYIDCIYIGLATHYIHSTNYHKLLKSFQMDINIIQKLNQKKKF